MQVFATSSYQKNYFQFQIEEATNGLINFIQEYRIGLMEDQAYAASQLPAQHNQQLQQKQELQQQLEQERLLQEEQQELNRRIVPEKSLKLTKEQLVYYDGSEGRPAYAAVNGIIYNMTDIIEWAGGTHFGLYAGRDLSNAFMKCHNAMIEILANIPQVGVLVS
jgi:predicted heme/steroid binding protein